MVNGKKLINMLKADKKFIFGWLILFVVTILFEAYYIKNNNLLGDTTIMPDANAGSVAISNVNAIQKFKCTEDSFAGIILNMDVTTIANPEKLQLVLNHNGKVVKEWSITKFDLNDSYHKFLLDTSLENVAGDEFELCLKSKGDSGILLGLTSNSSESDDVFLYNDEEKSGISLCFSIIKHNTSARALFFKVIAFTFLAFLVIGIFFLYTNCPKIEYTFLVCYIIMGIVQIFAVPIFKTPDEGAHFLRSYEISLGHAVSEQRINGSVLNEENVDEKVNVSEDYTVEVGRDLPEALLFGGTLSWTGMTNMKLYDLKDMYSYRIDNDNVTFISFANSALYAPGTYLPQALGISFARVFSDKALILAYAARLANWLISGLLLFFAIRYTPIGKNMIFLIAMMPMNMQQCNSMSPDAFTFSVCVALFSFVLYQRFGRKEKMKLKHYIIMYILVFILCQCKIVYVPLCLLLFLIPKERFGTKRKYILNIIGVALVGIVICLGWLIISSGLLIEIQPGVSPSEQVSWILHHPIDYITVMLRTIDANGDTWIRWALGEKLGWLNIDTSYILLFIYGILLIIVLFLDNDIAKVDYTFYVRGMMLGVSVIVIVLIMTSLYVQWTALRMPEIEGIQGRYFLPLLMLIFMALKPANTLINNKGINSRSLYLSVMSINICISTILLTNAI